MDNILSSDSDAIICVLYSEYLNRRSHRVPIEKALSFCSDMSIHDAFFPDWLPEDVTFVCFWLLEHEFIDGVSGDDHLTDLHLTEEGIIYMESRFARKRELVISHLRELVSFGISIAGIVAH